MAFTKIMCATDFSAGAQRALETATRLANAGDAELEIVHVWDAPTPSAAGLPVPAEVLDELRADALLGLEAAAREARARGAKRVTSTLLGGTPWSTIVEALGDPRCDLVVIGTQGRTGMARVMLGSVAEKVVRHAPCSTLVVRPTSEAKRFAHLLCPTDFSEGAEVALELAGTLARAEGSAITLLNVVELTIAYAGRRSVNYIHLLARSSRDLLDEAADRLRTYSSANVTARSSVGSPGGQTLALIDEDPSIDLVVMGSRGRTGLKRFLLGSVAEKVVRHARCPVLVARKREGFESQPRT